MSKKHTSVSQDEIEQCSLDASIGHEEEESIQASQEEKKVSQVPVKKGKQQKVVVVKPPASQKKSTKPPPAHPVAKVQSVPPPAAAPAKAANIALPETAPNGSKIDYYPVHDYQDEVVTRLKDLPDGAELFINRWRTVNGRFGPTHVMYTAPDDEDGSERAFWGTTRADRYLNQLNMETHGLFITKVDDQYYYGSFEK